MTGEHAELGNRTKTIATTEQIVDFVRATRFEDLDPLAVERTKTFLMDTLAVGVAGRCAAGSDAMLSAVASWGDGEASRVIGRPGLRLPAPTAAFLNGYQCHCLEWDCLHEEAVVIAMCVPVAALAAEAEQNPVSGRTFLTALALSVEIAVMLGQASDTAPRFFRPAVSGLMGAALGVAHMRGYGRDEMLQTLGLAYSQASGTMQAHWEGAMVLAGQVGVGARAAIQAADMAKAGIKAPLDVILGQFGFFTLFETADNIDHELGRLSRPWTVTDLAHKPSPAGRATQSVLTMFEALRSEHDFAASDVEKVIAHVPPLIMLLVGRPLEETMTSSYARLCLKVIGPMFLLDGEIDPRKLPEDAAPPEAVHALGERFDIRLNEITDPNALGPQSCEIVLKSGQTMRADCADPYGAITNPMSQAAREAKVRRCFEIGGTGADPEALIQRAGQAETLDDIRDLLTTVCGEH
jgi:2-methylcitrate dehydratase PrpD